MKPPRPKSQPPKAHASLKSRRMARWALFLLVALGFAANSYAGALSAAKVFSDNMVLQRNCPVPVWGWARPGELVKVEFKGQSQSASTGADGKWLVRLDPLPACCDPDILRIAGSDGGKVEFGNVLVGDVWLASGQSNMELSFTAQVAPATNSANPQIRLAGGMGTLSPEPDGNRFPSSKWKECTPENLLGFSRAGYYFASDLQQKLSIPIGVISMAVGCSTVESWMPPEAFSSHAGWSGELAEIDRMREIFRAKDNYSEAEKIGFMKEHAETRYGRFLSGNWMKDGKPIEGKFDFALWHALVVRPSTLYSHAVSSLCPFAIRGVIWYQGESNFSDTEYAEKQQALIESWRRMWGLGDFPFYTVQIAPFCGYPTLPDCWIQQYKTVRLVGNTGIVPTVDIAEIGQCHPFNKWDVGLRLAALALHDSYGQADVVASGPVYQSQEVKGSKIVVRFAQVHGGLTTRDGKAPDWFEIAGIDGKFVKGNVKIAGDTVEVSAHDVPVPAYVRCGWNQTAEPNLSNMAGWPVWPFNTALPFFSDRRNAHVTP